jgi:RNA 2',3'-cyclic 3'-phosphodiesterase
MRLFTGLAVPPEIAQRAMDWIAKLRPLAPGLAWTPEANLHVTTKFIGQWPEERLDELIHSLGTVSAAPFEVRAGRMGWLPNERQRRILLAVADGGDALTALAAQTEQVCALLGIEREKRAYRPHLTLARAEKPEDTERLLREMPEGHLGAWRVDQFVLYRSETKPAGPVYTKLAGFRFG